MMPNTSFYSEVRKTSVQGGSIAVRLPADFAKSLEMLNERNVKMFNLNNNYIIYMAEKKSHNDLYDLLQLALTVLGTIYHSLNEEDDVRKDIERAYAQLHRSLLKVILASNIQPPWGVPVSGFIDGLSGGTETPLILWWL